MKNFLTLILLLLMSLLLVLPAHAADIEDEQLDALGGDELVEAVPDSAELGEMGIMDALETEHSFLALFKRVKKNVSDAAFAGVRNALAIISTAALCAVAGTIFTKNSGINYVDLTGVLTVGSISAGGVTSFISQAAAVIGDLNAFSKALLPTLAAAATASGAVTSASAKLAASALFMDIFITISLDVVMPLIYALFALSLCSCAVGGMGLDSAVGVIKRVIKAVLTTMTLLFTVYISISGVVSETADAAAVKVAKSVISSSLPIVGSMISDAASTVLSGLTVLKSAVGIFGMIVVCGVCIMPFIYLAVNYLLYKAAAFFAECVSGSGVAKMIDATASVYAAILGTIGVDAIMIFFSIISFIRTVTV